MTELYDIAWITDSTATLTPEFIEENNVYVVPLSILFGEESYRENIDISAEDFYVKLSNSKELPKTSQPSIGEFVELYEMIKKKYKKAIAIHASSALTGTYQASVSAAKMVDFDVEVIDSKIGSYALGKMVEKGVQMYKEGKTFEEMVPLLRELPDKGRLFMAPGSLEQLKKGGRVSSTLALLGNLLHLKLIIKFDDGKAILFDKVRTERKMKERIYAIFHESSHLIKEASVIHGNIQEKAEEWVKELQGLYPQISFTSTVFSPVPGTHTGQGTIGLCWINE